MAKMRLTTDDVEYLRELRYVGAGRIYLESQRRLERLGLITIHQGRFGEYTRLTEEGTRGAEAAPVNDEVPTGTPASASWVSPPGERGQRCERKAMIRAEKRVKKKRR